MPEEQEERPEEGALARVVKGVVEPLVKPIEFLVRPIKDYFLDTKGNLEQHDQSFKDLDNKIGEILRRQAVMEEKIDNLRKETAQFRQETNRHFAEAKEDGQRHFAEAKEDGQRHFAEVKEDVNHHFAEIREDLDRRFNEARDDAKAERGRADGMFREIMGMISSLRR